MFMEQVGIKPRTGVCQLVLKKSQIGNIFSFVGHTAYVVIT